MDEEYGREIANYIFSIFCTNPFVVMSWGINLASVTVVDVGVKFLVQGFIHTASVGSDADQIAYGASKVVKSACKFFF